MDEWDILFGDRNLYIGNFSIYVRDTEGFLGEITNNVATR